MNLGNLNHPFVSEATRRAYHSMHNPDPQCYCDQLSVVKPCSVCCEQIRRNHEKEQLTDSLPVVQRADVLG